MAKPTIRTCAVYDMENEQPGSICQPCSDALHRLHYFRRVPFQDGSHVRYNHPKAPAPTQFVTECASCLALQENDAANVRRAMTQVAAFTRADLLNRVLACPRCGETCLFSTEWQGNTAIF